MYIFLLVLGGGQDKPAWTACPPGVKITRVGGKISRDSLPPGVQANRGWLAPRGASCPGGKINWDTGSATVAQWGLMGRSSNAHNFFNFPTERFEIFTICRRPPRLQTDARAGMIKIVVRETEARKASGWRTSTPR